PVVIGEVEPEQVAPELAALNWLFFRTEDDFSQVLQDLIHAIETDHAWVKEHTRLQVRALEWQRNDREGGYLLRGADLDRGEQWLATSPDKELEPTGLQTQYLLASRRAAIRRQRVTMGVVLTGLLLAIGLGALAWTQRNEAITQGNMRATAQSDAEAASTRAIAESWERATAQAVAVDESHMRATSEAEAETRAFIARSRQLAIASTSQLDVDQELALLLAVEAAREADTAEAADALRRALVHRGRTLRLLLGHGAEVYCAKWDPDGRRILSAGADGTARVWDAASGQERLVLRGHSGAVIGAVWDADGARIATAGADGTLRVWDAGTGLEQLTLEARPQAVNAVM
ncbi:MAG: WD40 repeat domain-containing protein, partial [Chloroflexota bacterium]